MLVAGFEEPEELVLVASDELLLLDPALPSMPTKV